MGIVREIPTANPANMASNNHASTPPPPGGGEDEPIMISVKWNGKRLDQVPLYPNAPASLFQATLYSLTSVPPERQKVLLKGGLVKGTEAHLKDRGVKPGSVVMMMGSASSEADLAPPPAKPTVFLEDMSEEQLNKAMAIPAGLVNLGNTCYLASTLQCLKSLDLLQACLKKSFGTSSSSSSSMDSKSAVLVSDNKGKLVLALNSLFQELQTSGTPVHPIVLVSFLRLSYPQFNEQDNHGYMQQDAEECWGNLVECLGSKVRGINAVGQLDENRWFVDQFMTGRFDTRTVCDAAPDEFSVGVEDFNKMRVNIGPGVSTYMTSDIAAGLVEKFEKNSSTLGTSTNFTKTLRVSRLPTYLTINFVRFQWKMAERVKAKILKKIKFPTELDMIPFCSEELAAKLAVGRNYLKEKEDRFKEAQKNSNANDPVAPPPVPSLLSIEGLLAQHKLAKDLGLDESLISDLGCNLTGQYELTAVLTHIGRTADSGHYIGWVKQGNTWWKYDDDKVTACTADDITKLEGGADWHISYLLIYKAKLL